MILSEVLTHQTKFSFKFSPFNLKKLCKFIQILFLFNIISLYISNDKYIFIYFKNDTPTFLSFALFNLIFIKLNTDVETVWFLLLKYTIIN